MKVSQIQAIARKKDIKPGKMKKLELIHAIQKQEGAFDCFASAFEGVCDQQACTWREDCFSAAQM
ncbi:MAG: SAP domain-containing protein [Ectothiorhodospiraceae bacterium]|nr:SAP domain-containing protein [Ectothiorhodospiraceae bacterium]